MAALPKKPYITPQEYLERERKAETKSEYHDGEIVAMAGVKKEHNRIAFDMARHIGNQLDSGPCEGFVGDMRVLVPECNRYFYPDIAVSCGEAQFDDSEMDSLVNPTLVIEILSDSTEAMDRGVKFDCYATLESLTTYVLVSQKEPRIEVFTRQADGSWRYAPTKGLDAVLNLEAIGCSLRLADIYARVPFLAASETASLEG